jgi:hypothetical protein
MRTWKVLASVLSACSLSYIAKKSPNLQHLHINFSVCEGCGEGPCDIGDSDLFQELSALPLTVVILESASFGFYDSCLYSQVATAFPEVIELRMPAQDATIKELVHFAKLPKLQHLLLNLDLTPVYREDTPTPAVGLALHTLETKGHFSPTGDLAALAK